VYFDSLLVPDEEIKVAGGVLKYWELAQATRPRVAQIALDFLSPPGQFIISKFLHKNLVSVLLLASSVDAERSFSCGRLQINHLQHNIGSQSFKAQMALES
jgi:hypothetical protein